MGKHKSKLRNMKRGPDVFQRDRCGRRYRVQARLKRELSDYSQLYTQLSHCRPLPELSYNSAPQPKMSNCLIISCNSENTVNCQTVRSASLTILRYFSFRIDFGYIYQSRRDAPRCPQEAREVAKSRRETEPETAPKSPNRKPKPNSAPNHRRILQQESAPKPKPEPHRRNRRIWKPDPKSPTRSEPGSQPNRFPNPNRSSKKNQKSVKANSHFQGTFFRKFIFTTIIKSRQGLKTAGITGQKCAKSAKVRLKKC